MLEYIYKENGKYYRELTDLTEKSFHKEQISKLEYMEYKTVSMTEE